MILSQVLKADTHRGPYNVEAKFHYASCFEAGSKQVRSWSATSFEPASVMEFGFYRYCIERRKRRLTVQQTHPVSVLVPSDTKKCSRQVGDDESHT